jgi:hypothetical protein
MLRLCRFLVEYDADRMLQGEKLVSSIESTVSCCSLQSTCFVGIIDRVWRRRVDNEDDEQQATQHNDEDNDTFDSVFFGF